MGFDILKPVLLTGAGFTHNFGGHLAATMWSLIFNHPEVQRNASLVHLLKNDFNYESVYHTVMNSDQGFGEKQRVSLLRAVEEAYEDLDQSVCDFAEPISPLSPVNLDKVNGFIKRFAGQEGSKTRGYFFSLNQDLFVERFYPGQENLSVPGFPKPLHIRGRGRQNLPEDDVVPVPNNPQLSELREQDSENVSSSGRFHYIKLHGSINWRSSEGKRVMVIGGPKHEHIKREPLLEWYFETFKRVLALENRHLMVIGYGFRDPHINKVIANSIKEHRLEWVVITPTADIEKFRTNLITSPEGELLWEGLKGYFPYKLQDIFTNQWETPVERVICSRLFG